MPIIEVNHVTKEYRLGQLQSLKHTLQRIAARLRGQPLPERPLFKALDDVDFKVEAGEVLGIIGHNGAGKSTLLKMLAQISVPTRGSVKVHGKVAPLIEVGAGLIGDLTGRENIFLNGAILGIPKAEIRKKFDEIVAFAELEEFIDTPLKRYSSGMSVRLGFAIATSIDADILIVDEVLAVGDLAFQRKCFDRMEEMIKRQGKTVLLVSHNIRQVERLCSRVLLLDHGRIDFAGEPRTVCDRFYTKNDAIIADNSKSLSSIARNTYQTGEIELVSATILDSTGHPITRIPYKADITIVMRFKITNTLRTPTFGAGIHTTDFLYLTTHNSEQQVTLEFVDKGECEIHCHIRTLPLLPGPYSWRIGVTEGDAARTVFYAENVLHFQIVADSNHPVPITSRQGFFELDANWSFESEPNVKHTPAVAGRAVH
ncbi:MAG: ABC transporter ATP-binding protein [Pseudomonadota bacterium]